MALKPEPKTVSVVCTACGLSWGAHGSEPTLETCVKLLKEELVRARYRPAIASIAYPTHGTTLGATQHGA